MTAPETMSNCPTDEALAAFIDGRLEGHARKQIVDHVAGCADCRDIVTAAGALALESRVVPIGARRSSRTLFYGAGLAAAAVVIVLFGPVLRDRFFAPAAPIESLVEASRTLRQRPVEGRLAGGFAYRPVKPVMRGSAESADNLSLLAAAQQIQLAARKNATPENLHTEAVSLLLLERTDEGVSALESVLHEKTGEREVEKAFSKCRDVSLLTDLAAAYLAQARSTGSEVAAFRAVKASQFAWDLQKSPETAWNRALAMEKTSSAEEAGAWRDYLQLDPGSEWAAEARRRIEHK